jgi:hypothetical protein
LNGRLLQADYLSDVTEWIISKVICPGNSEADIREDPVQLSDAVDTKDAAASNAQGFLGITG